MAHTHALAGDRPSDDDPSQATRTDVVVPAHAGHEGHAGGFWRHFGEMIVAMAVGMFVGLAIYLTAVGMTFDEALVRHPMAIVIVVAVGMTMPTVAWMRHRGHRWRRCAEMASVMVLPVIPFLCLVWFSVTRVRLAVGIAPSRSPRCLSSCAIAAASTRCRAHGREW